MHRQSSLDVAIEGERFRAVVAWSKDGPRVASIGGEFGRNTALSLKSSGAEARRLSSPAVGSCAWRFPIRFAAITM